MASWQYKYPWTYRTCGECVAFGPGPRCNSVANAPYPQVFTSNGACQHFQPLAEFDAIWIEHFPEKFKDIDKAREGLAKQIRKSKGEI